ncbi:MAG: ATP-binding protein [Bacteroidia bacterium]|jgi:Na+/proline symporter/nitrogen-specific signal transduction histidine kinase|nr:ATP-binding protein [Bacteroidia bacterium]
MNNWIIIACALMYLVLLFAVAYFAEFRLKIGKSVVNNPYVYALSLCVYCTAWTYYGSVGRAATQGIDFLTIYIGPTLGAALFFPVLYKIIRITKAQRVNSIADFISTRYGKNSSIASVVSLFCIIAVIPYIALQIKAISISLDVLTANSLPESSTIYITLVLAVFIIIFGTRSVDATEKHEGMVAAIAFESIVKLVAFVAAGVFVTYGVFGGFSNVFELAEQNSDLQQLFTLNGEHGYMSWFTIMMLSMVAVVFLPRQFQVGVIENIKEEHLKKAIWMFPLYLLVINVFVLPIAFGGKLSLPSSVDADTYVLAIPLFFKHDVLSLAVFIGGFSAATSMIIVETIALSTMVSNNLVMPILFSRQGFMNTVDQSIRQLILRVRRFSIIVILLVALLFDVYIAQYFSLVSIGLISFAGVAQLVPSILGGLFWKSASKNGALTGIIVGFLIWFYTLIVPALVNTHIIDNHVLLNGPFGISWLNPQALFGLKGFDSITHSLFWSMLFNCVAYFWISLYSKLNAQEIFQAQLFVDIDTYNLQEQNIMWRGTAYMPELHTLLSNFLGQTRAQNLIQNYAARHKIDLQSPKADPRMVYFIERILAGVIGSASARIMVSTVTKEDEISLKEVFQMLQESQQLIELNKELRKKSNELTRASEQLKEAYTKLKQMDEAKDEFLYTVTHELRTPLTSIRSMAEIVYDHPDLEEAQRQQFLGAVVKESERLSHLITQVLNLEKYENGKQSLHYTSFDFGKLVEDVSTSFALLAKEKSIVFKTFIPNSMLLLRADKDLLQQVIVNLLGNAMKFTAEGGAIKVNVVEENEWVHVSVSDTGKGIPLEWQPFIFDKFFQAINQTVKKPVGTGLGLAICKRIVEMHGGSIEVKSELGKGAHFRFMIPTFVTNLPS